MTTFEFLTLFADNYILYFVIAIPVVWLFVVLANHIADSWLNPIKFTVLTAGIGISVAVFLFLIGEATKTTFFYVIFSSALFWLILWFFFPKEPKSSKFRIKNEVPYSRGLFLILYFGNIAMTLFSYASFGIPLFNDDSRLATYTGSGGFGIILRLTSFLNIYSVFYLLYMYYKKIIGVWKLIILSLPLIVFGVLSGSRSSFLVYIFAFWGFNKLYLGKDVSLAKYKFLLVPFLLISIFTFSLEHSSNFQGGLISFLERVVACGDLYWYALPDDTWKELTINTPIKDLTVGFFGPFRLMSEAETDMPIGFQLTRLVYADFDKMTGPVELFPISSLAYFGYVGGIFFTVFQAFAACAAYRLFYRRSSSLIFASFYYFAFYKSIDFLASFKGAASQLFDILLNLGVIVIFCMLIAPLCEPTPKRINYKDNLNV